MLLNDKPGHFGSFSSAGRDAAARNPVLSKEKFFKTFGKKTTNILDRFDKSTNKDGGIDENIDIFTWDHKEIFDISSQIKQTIKAQSKKGRAKSANNEQDKYKYYKQHRDNPPPVKEFIKPSCTKYDPKYTCVKRSLVQGAQWKTLTARKDWVKQDNSKFYISQEDITLHKAGNIFIDLSKQPSRKENINPTYCWRSRLPSSKNLTRAQSAFNITRSTKKSKTSNFRPYTSKLKGKSNIGSAFKGSKQTPKKYEISDDIWNTTLSAEDSYEKFRPIYEKRQKLKTNVQDIQAQQWKNKIKAPDFKKIINRDYIDKLKENKATIIPFSLPNFKQVRERPIMMVKYDRIKHKINVKKEFKGWDNTINYDPNKVLDKINNHVTVNAPSFKMMTSRPCDNTPLPSYMKQIYSRNSCYSTTDLTLKMNNFANGGFLDPSTSFWPKRSFNKIINLNLLNSKKFLSDIIGDPNAFEERKDHLGKTMKFYNKNYKDLLQDQLLTKFDNVTWKSVSKNHNFDTKEIEKFLYNYNSE